MKDLTSRIAQQAYEKAAEALRAGDVAQALIFLALAERREQRFVSHAWVVRGMR